MGTLSALLVDDEQKNRDSLRKLLELYCPDVQVVGEADSVEGALEALERLEPELVFLDVEMPGGTGFDFLRRAGERNFRVIFVTAHSHYAIKAIRFSAIDYLLKPVDTDDLVEAVRKAMEERSQSSAPQHLHLLESLGQAGIRKLAIPIRDGIAFLAPEEIVRLEADGTYTHVYTLQGKYTGTRNIKVYEQLLSEQGFFRAHHSHLINLRHVRNFSRVDGYFVEMADGSRVEISRRKKDEFLERMSYAGGKA